MNININVRPVRIIHWDYFEFDVISPADCDIQMLTGPIKDNDTDDKKGLYLRWALRVYLQKDLTLSCIAEQDFIVDINDLNEDLFITITKISLDNFKETLSERIKQTNLTIHFQVDVTYQEASRLLHELREQ